MRRTPQQLATTLTLLAALAATLTVGLTLTWAAPPPGKGGGNGGGGGGGGGEDPPAPAVGKIYYSYGGDANQWSMDGDGSNKQLLEMDENMWMAPSSRRYSGYHWTLFTRETGTYDHGYDSDGILTHTDIPHRDLFAWRPDGNGGQELQLTDFYGGFNAQSQIHLYEGLVVWSNDGMDSFISFRARDWRDEFAIGEDGSTELHLSSDDQSNAIIVLPVSGAALDAAANAGTWEPIRLDDAWEIAISGHPNEANFRHTWSPDGTMIAYTVATEGTLYVSDLLTGDRAILFDGGNITQVPRWQPDGNLITFGSGGIYWSVLPDGSELTPLVSYELNQYGANFFRWSPDGRHLVFRESSYRGFKYFYQLQRLDIQTGEMIELTTDLDKAANKRPLAWLPE